jgi:hypothetical protein
MPYFFLLQADSGQDTLIILLRPKSRLNNKNAALSYNNKMGAMMSGSKTPVKKWLWIELIGFDNTLPDFGVSELLKRMEIKPEAVALLLCSPEIIHSHKGLAQDFRIGAQHCSYLGRDKNGEKKRQDWTAFQLRDLLSTLAKQGLQTYVSVFNLIMTEQAAKKSSLPDFDVWAAQHPELRYQLADGNFSNCICAWKTLADGTPYEDFLSQKLPDFLRDYGFSGFMASDGYAQPRAPLAEGDFSDEMIAQFSAACGIVVPHGSVSQKAAWILAEHRYDWCCFHVQRQARFIKKIASAVHACGKRIVALSAWVRDPFEAIWRYGVDYRELVASGIDALIIESSAGTIEIEGWNAGETTEILDRNRAMLLRMRAHLPETEFIQLHCIKDDCEEYCVLQHAPPLAASEILSMASMRFADTGERCVAGVMACLADAIPTAAWKFLDDAWRLSFTTGNGNPESPLLLWSDAALDRELVAYPMTRRCSSFRTTAELITHGVPLAWSGTLKAARKFPDVPLLIIHPRFWSKEELSSLLTRNVPVFLVGILPDDSFGIECWQDNQCRETIRVELQPGKNEERFLFWQTLDEALPPATFWEQAADLLNRFGQVPIRGQKYRFYYGLRDFDPTRLRLWSFADGTLFAHNTSPRYLPARFHTRKRVIAAGSLTFYPFQPVKITAETDCGSRLDGRIPPYGTAVLKLKYENQ